MRRKTGAKPYLIKMKHVFKVTGLGFVCIVTDSHQVVGGNMDVSKKNNYG